jgi:hypothetical protein
VGLQHKFLLAKTPLDPLPIFVTNLTIIPLITTFISSYIISLVLSACGGRPFHPSVPSSVLSFIHPSSSSWKKKMMEEEKDDEWRQEQFIEMFM